MLLKKEHQLAHQVALAEGMQAVFKAQVAGKKVVHKPAGELGNDADGRDGLGATLGLNAEESQQGRGQHMQPMGHFVDSDPRRLIQSGLLIREVAFHVGYTHTTDFAVALKRAHETRAASPLCRYAGS